VTVEPTWILVVEDDPADRMLVFRLLERAGYQATVADNDVAALELLHEEPFDVVLLALTALDSEEYAVLRVIKEEGRLDGVLVIAICSPGDRRAAVRAIELGADDYLEKPYEPALLHTRVEAVLTKKRLKAREAEYQELRLSSAGSRR
jgi:DNA-binding response OmpR family regulator